jgi:hypothetical protein
LTGQIRGMKSAFWASGVTDLSGQVGHGFGRSPDVVLAEGCGFRYAGALRVSEDNEVYAVWGLRYLYITAVRL